MSSGGLREAVARLYGLRSLFARLAALRLNEARELNVDGLGRSAGVASTLRFSGRVTVCMLIGILPGRA